MMWSSRTLSSSAIGSIAATDGWSGTASLWRDRVLRGAAVRLGTNRTHVAILHGVVAEDPVAGATVSLPLPHRMRLQVAGLRMAEQVWGSALLSSGSVQQLVSIEVVRQPHGLTTAILWRRSLRPWRIEAFAALAPDGVSSPLSATPTAARDAGWIQLRAAASWSKHGLLVRGGWTETQRNTLTVERRQAYSLQTVARYPFLRFEALLRGDQTAEQELEAETPGDWQQQREHRLLLRLAFPVRDGSLTVERRSRLHSDGTPQTPHGVGWRL